MCCQQIGASQWHKPSVCLEQATQGRKITDLSTDVRHLPTLLLYRVYEGLLLLCCGYGRLADAHHRFLHCVLLVVVLIAHWNAVNEDNLLSAVSTIARLGDRLVTPTTRTPGAHRTSSRMEAASTRTSFPRQIVSCFFQPTAAASQERHQFDFPRQARHTTASTAFSPTANIRDLLSLYCRTDP